jgi:PAS domain S-box-containing protein
MSELDRRRRLSLAHLPTKHLQPTRFVDEVNRQIANHLAMLGTLLRVRAKSFGQMYKPMSGEDVQFVLDEFADRLETVGKLHRWLASMANGPHIDIAEYLAEIAQGLVSSLTVEGQMTLDCEFPVTCVLPVEQAATLGLLIGKLITNAVKYAHPAGVAGTIKLGTSRRDDATIAIEVSDDGVGLPDDTDPLQSQSISFRTIRMFAKQIGASISFDNYGLGLSCRLELPCTLQCAPTEASEAPIVVSLHKEQSKRQPKGGRDRSPAADVDFFQIVQNLPVAVYSTDAVGRIAFYNEAAVSLWGRRPKLGEDWCGSWRLHWPDGTPMEHDECPMAVTLKTGQAARGAEAIAQRPDGTRVRFLAYPTPLRNDNGQLLGAVNMLVDFTERKRNEEAAQHYAAIVDSSEDAIVSKDINGVIMSWNSGAQRLFGYTSQEAVGKPVTMLIPADRHDEEPRILERIRRGERIDHYETVRQRKDRSLVDISLTVSPIRDLRGKIIGASKIARDITERKRAEERQHLLLGEMDHRVKNLFALASSVLSLSGRSAGSVPELIGSARDRLLALSRAHALTLSHGPRELSQAAKPATLHSLIQAITAPHDAHVDSDASKFSVTGCDMEISGPVISSLALLLHEFATNSTKHGALSATAGRIQINCANHGETLVVTWTERGGPEVVPPTGNNGFGELLIRSTIAGLGGEISRDWQPEGLVIRLSMPRVRLTG